MRHVPGIADARMQQANNAPQLSFDADRARIAQLGLTEQRRHQRAGHGAGGHRHHRAQFLAQSRRTTCPMAWSPRCRNTGWTRLTALHNLPVTGAAPAPQVLGALGHFTRTRPPAVVSQYNILPDHRSLCHHPGPRSGRGCRATCRRSSTGTSNTCRAASMVTLRGQTVTMNAAFSGLFLGLLGAIVLIYLLIVVNFQSWLDPFVIITALPAALAGIVWTLFATGTTLSVPALTGAIMCMGVATANSILVVSFARERLAATGDPMRAAVEAGFTRFRPVLMTALAMIIGMAPMALGLGEGGEQNAPLGRAVIGGLDLRHLRHPDVRAGGIQHRAWPRRTPRAAPTPYADVKSGEEVYA